MNTNIEKRFNQVYQDYSNLLFSVIYPYFNNKEDTKDVLQDVFVTFLKKDPNLENDNLKYWLIRVAINTSINYLKNPNRNTLELVDDYKDDTNYNQDDSIYNEVCKLDIKYKSVIILYYYEDLSVEEISKSLKISLSNVKQRLKRAREILKVVLEEK